MVEELRTAFIQNLPNIEWMDDATRKSAKEKASLFIASIILYIDEILMYIPSTLAMQFNQRCS